MTTTTQTAGGAMYHQAPRPGAPDPWAALRSWPQDGANGSPRPMKESVVSVKIAPANVRTVFATIRLTTLGRMWRRMMWIPLPPMTRARSTNIRSFTESACERMIRAVEAQLVTPMTTTITKRVARIPKNSASVPTMSRMIGARTIARTNVGRTRKSQ